MWAYWGLIINDTGSTAPGWRFFLTRPPPSGTPFNSPSLSLTLLTTRWCGLFAVHTTNQPPNTSQFLCLEFKYDASGSDGVCMCVWVCLCVCETHPSVSSAADGGGLVVTVTPSRCMDSSTGQQHQQQHCLHDITMETSYWAKALPASNTLSQSNRGGRK